MSRTDVHAPNWVKARTPEWGRYFEDFHNHATGPCDLAESLAAGRVFTRTRCNRWMVNRGRNISCSCVCCSGQLERKYHRRQERAQWRVARQLLLAGGELP